MSQPGPDGIPVERMRALLSMGDLDAPSGPIRQQAPPPPPMPPPKDCVSSTEQRPPGLKESGLLDRLDLRLDPALLLAPDGLPPVAFDLGLQGWARTLALTAHVRARPAPGWLQVRVTSQNLSGELMEEDAVVWDSTGRLVTPSRQLCGVRVPDGYTLPG